MKLTVFLVCAAALLLAAPAAPADGLGIGDAAPRLEVSQWIKGEPVDLAAAKDHRIVVLEFWATWCAPCVESIPHLTRLQQEYADQGVVIVAVSPHDPNNTLETVRKLVDKQGDKIGYAVAFDREGKSDKAFMEAANQEGIPTAFVIDKAGRVAWIGHPMDGMDKALARMVAGKYDIRLAGKKFDLQQSTMQALLAGDFERVMELTDEHLALDPQSPGPWMARLMVYTMHLPQPDQALATARKAVAALHEDGRSLAFLAGMLAEDRDSADMQPLALEAVSRAVELAPQDAEVRASQYLVLAALGRDQEAFTAASEAVRLMKGNPRALSEFARVLSSPDPKNRCNALAIKAVELALAAEPEEPAHLEAKFYVLAVCEKDLKAAEAVGRYLIERAAEDADLLNDLAWRLLTEKETRGKFNELALAAAEKCHLVSGGNNWMYLDTLALIKFATGSVAESIELEKRAIELCDNEQAKDELKAALRRFEAG